MRWCIVRALFAVALALLASRARANGRYPRASQIVVGPEAMVVARATFGLLVSRDGGATWDWVCESAIGFSGAEDPFLAVTPKGTMLAALREGVARSSDGGCSWSFALRAGAVDLASRGSHLVALTASPAGARLYASDDDGASFDAIGAALDPSITVETIDLAPSDAHRVYLSGARFGADGGAIGVLLVSGDDGGSFAERAVPIDSRREHAPFIAAVDSSDADRVFLRTSPISQSRLLFTADAGASFATLFTSASDLTGFARFGARVYLGTANDGVLAESAGAFAPIASADVRCLAAGASWLWICASESISGYAIGALADGARAVTPKLHLSSIRGPIACPSASSASACAAEWNALAPQLGVAARSDDAGASAPPIVAGDGGATDAGAPVKRLGTPSSSGCAAAPSSSFAAGATAIAAAALLALRRRSARR